MAPRAAMSRLSMIRETVEEFLADDCARYAAATSYYAVFSLPALAALAGLFLGLFLDPETLERTVARGMTLLVSEEAAEAVRPVVRRVENPLSGSPATWILAALGLLFGSTGAFVQVQAALNRAWYVQTEGATVRTFLWKRTLSFLLLGGMAVLLLAALGTSALVLAAGRALAGRLVEPVAEGALVALDLVVTLGVLTLVFAAVLRLLPDAEIAWRDVLGGALGTAILFWAGKSAIALYLSTVEPTRVFGVAGSLALLLLWVYYTAALLFLGAEWTQVRARRGGRPIRPSPGAELTPRGRRRAEADAAGS